MVSEDTNHFHQGLVQDVRRVSREIQEAGVPKYPHELVGIEIFVTEGLARRVEVARREHIRAVLYEQMLQRRLGICDVAKRIIIVTASVSGLLSRIDKCGQLFLF